MRRALRLLSVHLGFHPPTHRGLLLIRLPRLLTVRVLLPRAVCCDRRTRCRTPSEPPIEPFTQFHHEHPYPGQAGERPALVRLVDTSNPPPGS